MPSDHEVESFIRSTFRSVWALELLILLKANRDHSLSHEDMVERLRASDLIVSQNVELLAAAGLVLPDGTGGARYNPISSDLDLLTDQSERAYAKSPDAVRRLIIASTTRGLTAFADAFKLRKD